MALDLAYDHPNHTIRRELTGRAGGAASTRYAPFRMKQVCTLVAAHLIYALTGTSTASTWEIRLNGLTLTSAQAMSFINIVGTTQSVTINRSITSLSDVYDILSPADSTGRVDVVWEYRVDFPSTGT